MNDYVHRYFVVDKSALFDFKARFYDYDSSDTRSLELIELQIDSASA